MRVLLTVLAVLLSVMLAGCETDDTYDSGYSTYSYPQDNSFSNWQSSMDQFHDTQVNDGHMAN